MDRCRDRGKDGETGGLMEREECKWRDTRENGEIGG
jgi:hypothetical protein